MKPKALPIRVLPTEEEIKHMYDAIELMSKALRSEQDLSRESRELIADLLDWQSDFVTATFERVRYAMSAQ